MKQNEERAKCQHNCDLINWDTGNYQCPNCGALVSKYGWIRDRMKNNPTPNPTGKKMKDWEREFENRFDVAFSQNDKICLWESEIKTFISQLLTTQKELFIKIIENKRGEIYNDSVSEEYTRDEKQCYRQGASDYLTVVLAELEREDR